MKTTHGTRAFIISCLTAISAYGQNTIQFTGIRATEEKAIQLTWASNTNEYYEIDEADSLIDTNTGTITWNTLYDNYPSQGTNTLWLDTGNYDTENIIPHPKYAPMRFYRIVTKGTNDGEIPGVTVFAPTNNSVLSDLVTVSVNTTSSYPEVDIKLYVDGQEMGNTDDGTNFVINTCEWPNGPHVIFATAIAFSSRAGPSGDFPVSVGRAASSFVPVIFSNLISKVAFSQAFFEPSLGQTQEVTASFGANVDWTLQIVDEDSNAVRTVTGSGTNLVFDWDGTGDSGTNIPDGVYNYTISAVTNGDSFSSILGGSSLSMESAMYDDPEIPWVLSGDDGVPVPLSIYPTGIDTNGLTIFEASQSEVGAAEDTLSTPSIEMEDSGGASPDASGSGSQSTTAPTRPPTAPVKNAVNNYAIGYYTFKNGRSIPLPGNGIPPPLTQKIHLDGFSSTGNVKYSSVWPHDDMAIDMIREMKKRGWKLQFDRADDSISVNSIRRSDQNYGGGEIFTQATIGLFMDHGSFGTDQDFSAGSSGSKQIYFPSNNSSDSGDNEWLRLCQFGFGGNLKWMAIHACFSLCDPNYSSMVSHGAIPLKTTHLLCAASTVTVTADHPKFWAIDMLQKKQKIVDAWFNAGTEAFKTGTGISNSIVFRVTGYPECFDDSVTNDTAPSDPSPAPGNLTKRDDTVFQLP